MLIVQWLLIIVCRGKLCRGGCDIGGVALYTDACGCGRFFGCKLLWVEVASTGVRGSKLDTDGLC